MQYYIDNMDEEFLYEIKPVATAPWNEKLFKVVESAEPLNEEKKAIFHTYVMTAMFLCKRTRPNVEPAVSFLSTRTTKSDENDCDKLVRTLGVLKETRDDILTLEADDTQTLT